MRVRKNGYVRAMFLALLFSVGVGVLPLTAQNSTNAIATPTPTTQSDDRSVSLKQLPGNILTDQKEIWLFPVRLAHGSHWWPTVGVLGVTAGLIAGDPHMAPPFRTTNDFSGFNNAFSDTNAAAMIAAVPAALYGIGWLRKDSYAQNSGLLAAEAVADGFLLDIPFKAITARRQPISYTGNGPYNG